ncbi:MAG TPA: hypothetical protein VM121_07290 [Acidimicrobiales bacterium]|nr:hypothetical protein [Acidimicrobiales bacterium]
MVNGGPGLTTVDVDLGGWEVFPAPAGFLLLSAVGYVVARGLLAQRRGEDVGRATAAALWAVGPPLILALVGLLLLVLLAGVAAIVLFFIVIAAIVGGELDAGTLILLVLVGLVLLFLAVVGAASSTRSLIRRSCRGIVKR